MTELRFDFPALPVSVNRLYRPVAGGRRTLTDAGKAYRNNFVTSGGGVPKAKLLQFSANPDSAYQVSLWFYFPFDELYNATYGEDKRVKSPFKDVDVDNLAKLAIDCIAQLLGIRDRNNFSVCLHKREAPDSRHRMVAIVLPLNLDEDPFPLPAN